MASISHVPDSDPNSYFDRPQPSEAEETGLDLRRVFGVLRRRKVMIAGIMFVITTLATLFVNQLTPLYRAQTQVVVQPSRQNVVDIQAVTQGITPDFYTNETEAAIIASRALAEKAVQRLDLLKNPMFNPLLATPKPRLTESLVGSIKKRLLALIATSEEIAAGQKEETKAEEPPPNPLMQLPAEERERILLEAATQRYMGGLSVRPSSSSRVITVSYSSSDPAFAALAANTTAELYILEQLSTKGEATTRAAEFLTQRVNELRDVVVQQERDLARFRRKAGLINQDGINLYQQQLADLSRELLDARTKRAEGETRYGQVEALARSGDSLDSAAAVLDSSLIARLREQEAEVIRKLAELRTSLREGHPRLQLAESELLDLRAAIQREVDKVVIGVKNELEVTRVREANLQMEVDRVRTLIEEQNRAQADLQAIESELRANTQLYETFLERMRETNVLEESDPQADARVISRATVPGGPYFPNKRLMIAAALAVSGFIAVVLAFLVEFLDRGFRSTSQLETMSGVPSLGMIPKAKIGRRDGKTPHELALEKPNSAFGEAVRSLRTGLMLSSVDRPPKSVLITASLPGEGKSTTAISLATMAAKSGQRVIIVDCDLRHANLHLLLRMPNRQGLSHYLAGQATLSDVIDIDPKSTVHYITAGNRPPDPATLLGSDEMRSLLRRLEKEYDLVVLDMPPLLAVSDALVLVRAVDKTVFIVRWEKTRRESAIAGLRQVIDAGGDIAGTVLAQVDLRRHAQYDYSDSGYYYHRSYRQYYGD